MKYEMWNRVTAVLACIFTVGLIAGCTPQTDPPAPQPSQSSVTPTPTPTPSPSYPDGVQPDNGSPPLPLPGSGVNTVIMDGLGAAPFVSVTGKNPWTPPQAVAWYMSQIKHSTWDFYQHCLGAVGLAYGWQGTGDYSAMTYGNSVPQSRRFHVNKDGSNVPAGALLLYTNTGGNPYGHIELSFGGGSFGSNDIDGAGRVYVTTIAHVRAKWGYTPTFWTYPIFPNAGGRNPDPAPKVPNDTPVTHKPSVTVQTYTMVHRPRTVNYVAKTRHVTVQKLCRLNPQIGNCSANHVIRHTPRKVRIH